MRLRSAAACLLLPSLLRADPVADLRAQLQARAEKQERLTLADLGDFIPRSEATLARYGMTLVASASVSEGAGLAVELPSLGLQDAVDIGWAMAERDAESPTLPEVPEWLGVDLLSVKVTGPKLTYRPDGKPSSLEGGGAMAKQALGRFSAEFGGPAISFDVPLGELAVGSTELAFTLAVKITPGEEAPLSMTLTGADPAWRPPGVTWMQPAGLSASVTLDNEKRGSASLTLALGGRKAWDVASLPLTCSVPIPRGDATPEFSVSLTGRTLLDIVLWVCSLMPPEALPTQDPRALLKWPSFAPSALDPATLRIPEMEITFPGPFEPSASSAKKSSGPRLGLSGALGKDALHGVLGPGGFRIDLPGGGDWTMPGVPWLGLKKTRPQLVLGGAMGYGLALAGENTLGGKPLQLQVDVGLKGGVKPGVVDVRMPAGTTALTSADLVAMARDIRKRMSAASKLPDLDPFAKLPKLPSVDLDLALVAPQLRILPEGHPQAEDGGTQIGGELRVGGSSWGKMRGLADADGLRLGGVDLADLRIVLGKLVLELPAKAHDLDLGLYVAATKPKPTPLMLKLVAGAKDGKPSKDFLGIRGLTADDVQQTLSLTLDGTVTFTASGRSGLIPGKTLSLGTTITGGMGTMPAASIEAGIDSLSLLDLVRVANSLAPPGSRGIPEKGVPDAELLPSRAPDAGDDVQVRFWVPSGFGFSGRLVVEEREWFDTSFDLAPGRVSATGSATSFPAGPVTIRNPRMDLRMVAGPTPPSLSFGGGLTISGDLVKYSGDVAYRADALGQSFSFSTKLANRYQAEVRYSLAALPSPDVSVHAGLAGAGLDRLKEDLFGALGAAARAADEAVAAMRKASRDAQAKRQEKLDAVKRFTGTWDKKLRDYVGKAANLDSANARWRKIPKVVRKACHLSKDCKGAKKSLDRANKAWKKAVKKYGEKKVRAWLKKYGKKKVISRVLAHLPGYSGLKKAVDDAQAAAQRASDDLAAKEQGLLGPLNFSKALAGPTRAADMVVLKEAAFTGSAAGFVEGKGVTLEVLASLKGKPGTKRYQVPWGPGAVVSLGGEVMKDL
jgi:hypothetical protein